MSHGALSSRAVLALSTAALVAITSGATALVVLTGTATLVGLDDALDPRPPGRAGDALAVVQLPVPATLRTGGPGSAVGAPGSGPRRGTSPGPVALAALPGFRPPGAALISTLPGTDVVGFAPQLPGPVPAAPLRGGLVPVPGSPAVLSPTGAVVALPTGPPVPTATVLSDKAARRLSKQAPALAVPTTLALVQPRLVTASPAPVAVDGRDRTAAAQKSAAQKSAAQKLAAQKSAADRSAGEKRAQRAAVKKAAKKAVKRAVKKAAAAKDSPRKQAGKPGRKTVAGAPTGAAKKALAR